ncbi:hypothetical protein ANN_02526 [Periplaneta americana]|uniref:Uncharacterized protein n=1 Tax=Periplaneta americana TaxID=6978 RepID=A0ABQ8TXN9_PERAM|nr:hypothetical protein ANN_02526 [Periplaneta americana]
MASPTPSLDSLPGANSVGSLVDQTELRSLSPVVDSPVTLSGSSPAVSITSVSCSSSSSSSNSGSVVGSSGSTTITPVCVGGISTKCGLCNETFTNLKVLPCFHTFCHPCLEKNQEHPDKLTCSLCQQDCILTSQGISALIPDFNSKNNIEPLVPNEGFNVPLSSNLPHCTGCKSRESDAVARCLDCDNFLCPNCMMAHQFMHCFEGHRVLSLGELQQNGGSKEDLKNGIIPSGGGGGNSADKPVSCMRHKTEPLKYFCRTCNGPICKECTLIEHPSGLHDYEHLSEIGPKQLELMTQTMQESKGKATDIRNTLKNLEHTSSRLQVQYHKAQNEINDTFQFYRSMIEERKQELLKELESVFSAKQMSLNVLGQKAQETIEKIYSTCDFVDRITKHATMAEALMFKRVFDTKFQAFMTYNPEVSLQNGCDLEFVSNYQAIQVGVRNTFGYVRSSSELPVGPSKQPPIARPVNGTVHLNGGTTLNGNSSSMNGAGMHGTINGGGGGSGGSLNGSTLNGGGLNGVLDRPYSNGLVSTSSSSSSPFESNIISKRFSSANSLGPFSTTISDLNLNGMNPYEKWSNGGSDSIFQNGGGDHYSLSSGGAGDSMLDLTSKLMSTAIFPRNRRSNARR